MTTKYVKQILPKDSIIIHNNIYYEINTISREHYHVKNINHEIVSSIIQIRHFDCEIVTLPTKTQTKIKQFNEFRTKYNNTIDYLNKYKCMGSSRYHLLDFTTMMRIINIECGITIRHLYGIMIYLKKTQDKTLQIYNIFENPFNFIKEEKQLISYLIAEKICCELNITILFEIKCEKWSFYHIIHKYNSFYVNEKMFYDDFKQLCEKNEKKYTDYINIIKSVTIKKYIDNKCYVTTQYLYDYEKKLTSTLIDFYSNKNTNINSNLIDTYIGLFEKYMTKTMCNQYVLDKEQKIAVKNALTNNLSIITGFPGTGKSSIVQCILYVLKLINEKHDNIFEDEEEENEDEDEKEDEEEENSTNKIFDNSNVSIMSPTGLAFVNIQKKCSYIKNGKNVYLFNPKISGTCHKILYNIFPNIESNIFKQANKKHYDDDHDHDDDSIIYIPKIIIVDEFSMMDIFMFKELIDYCIKFEVHLILIGDHNQLPSIGPGCILNSFIETNKEYELFSISNLTKIKRQEKGSLLKNIIKMTKVGLNKDDFIDDTMQFIDISLFLNKCNTIDNEKLMEFINSQNLNKDNCKFLSYFNGENNKSKTHPTNVLELNKILQNKFNPEGLQLDKRLFDTFSYKINDIIIRIENNTTDNVFRANGEQAVIKRFDKDNVYIKYLDGTDEETICLDRFYNEFKLAYALTVHKSQGSEYKYIVIFVESNSYVWDKPALYTAISRAQDKCFIIADYTEFLKIQKNNKNSKKPTLFLKEIEKMYDII
jgi:exodeoxyribonuclease V alpha subunit